VTPDSLFGDPTDLSDPSDSSDRPHLDEIVIYCDGGSRGNPGPSAIGAVVLDPSSDPPRRVASVSERIGITTNNVAEYRALIAGLEAAAPFGARRVRVRADSKLVVEQVKGTWKVKQPHLRPLLEQARKLLGGYADVDLQHVPRAENTDADALVNAALDAPAPAD
jgi:ribonuclease HI